jgi:3-deoxy-manno-octulosonate cytidylyltransferase (CMP-KDO synthetase)
MQQDTVIIIPSRLAATRLPNKPILKIAGKEMILHVMERAMKFSHKADVFVAAGDEEIASIVEKNGGKAILTNPNLACGTDRVYEAYKQIDPDGTKYKNIVNLQGDMPNFDLDIIEKTLNILENTDCDIATVASICTYEDALKDSVVKAVFGDLNHQGIARALYFSRALVPYQSNIFYSHVGIYGFRKEAITKFVSKPVSKLEQIERIEPLRALEDGMKIYISVVDNNPISVDTPEDLVFANKIMS